MKRKIPLIILATFAVSFSASAHQTKKIGHTHKQTNRQELRHISEPGAIIQPFNFAAHTWFATDKAILRSAGKAELDVFANNLLQQKNLGQMSRVSNIEVIGHTDSRASHAYNQELSERRAAAVSQYLVSKGIAASMLSSKGMGETQPVASNRTKAGMQKNRRVEINVAGPSVKVVSN